MKRQKELPACPVKATLGLIGDKWTALIINELLHGTMRFGELRKALNPITQKVLTAHLRAMEENAHVARKVYAEVPPRVEYTLTHTGYSLQTILDAMMDWGTKYQQDRRKEMEQAAWR